jgi:DNA-directed RNA polymerase II subunit RPB1
MEMNIFSPGSVETATELEVLSSVENHIISSQSNKANIVVVQDCVLGAYLMTSFDMNIPREDFFLILNSMSGKWDMRTLQQKQNILKKHSKTNQEYSGKILFSMLLPNDFHFKTSSVHIEYGVLLEGVMTKKELGGGHYSMITLLFNEYPPDISIQFINDIQFMCNSFLLFHGFSIGLKDCIISKNAIENIQLSNTKLFEEAYLYEKSIISPSIRELHISRILGNARDRGMKIAKDELGTKNKFVSTVVSGSKGDYFNIAQIMSLLGQQNFQGRRIQPSLNNNTRTLPHYPFEWDESTPTNIRYQSQGFIENSFIRGLHPTEFWFHCITGREGITDTAMKTATSGYIQRRMVKVAEDVQVKYDGTVRNAVNSIIQFHYGENGLEPTKCIIKDNKMMVCDVERLVNKLNKELEI